MKLIDFGSAIRGSKHPAERQVVGTPGYIAPELLMRHSFDHKIDVYSCGIVLYFMLTGSSPFYAATAGEVLELNKKNKIEFDKFPFVTKEARDLIWRLTNTNPGLRLNATEALCNEWLIKNTSQLRPKDLMKNNSLKLNSYDFYNDLTKEIPNEFDNSKEFITFRTRKMLSLKVNRVPSFAIKDNILSCKREFKSNYTIKGVSNPLRESKHQYIKGLTCNDLSSSFNRMSKSISSKLSEVKVKFTFASQGQESPE